MSKSDTLTIKGVTFHAGDIVRATGLPQRRLVRTGGKWALEHPAKAVVRPTLAQYRDAEGVENLGNGATTGERARAFYAAKAAERAAAAPKAPKAKRARKAPVTVQATVTVEDRLARLEALLEALVQA